MIPLTNTFHCLSQQDFDLEADCDDFRNDFNVDSKAVERRRLKLIRDLNKKKRVSLFAPSFQAQLPPPRKSYHHPFHALETEIVTEEEEFPAVDTVCTTEKVVLHIFSYLTEFELMTKAFAISKAWSEFATIAHANLLVGSIRTENELVSFGNECSSFSKAIMDRSWDYINRRFPWACYLAEGGAKKVYKAYNSHVRQEEAISVM